MHRDEAAPAARMQGPANAPNGRRGVGGGVKLWVSSGYKGVSRTRIANTNRVCVSPRYLPHHDTVVPRRNSQNAPDEGTRSQCPICPWVSSKNRELRTGELSWFCHCHCRGCCVGL